MVPEQLWCLTTHESKGEKLNGQQYEIFQLAPNSYSTGSKLQYTPTPWICSSTISMGSPKEGTLSTSYRLRQRLTEGSTKEATPTEYSLANKVAKLVTGHCKRLLKGKTKMDRV